MTADLSDPRVTRTRRHLVEAFVALCSERGFGSFGVKEVARKAGVNRATFYRHFENLQDIEDRGLEIVLDGLAARFTTDASLDAGDWTAAAERRVAAFFGLVVEHDGLFEPIMRGKAGPTLSGKASSFLESFLFEERVADANTALMTLSPPLAARALSSMLIGMASWLLDHRTNTGPDSLARSFIDFCGNGLFRPTT